MKRITEEEMESAKKVLADYQYQKAIETLFGKPEDYILNNNIFDAKIKRMYSGEYEKISGRDKDFIVVNFRLNDFYFQEKIEVGPYIERDTSNADVIARLEHRAKVDEAIIDVIIKRFSEHLKGRLSIKIVKQ